MRRWPLSPDAEDRTSNHNSRGYVGGISWVASASFAVGGINYGFALALTALLGVQEYSVFAGGQALLLIAGTAAAASIPWVLAAGLAKSETKEDRESILWFAVVSSGLLGVASGLLMGALASQFAPLSTSLIVALGTMLMFWASITIGWLQGSRKFQAIAALKVAEAGLKAIVGLSLVLLGAESAGALGGFVAGAAVVLAFGIAKTRSEWSPSLLPLRTRALWVRAGAMGSIQTLVAVMASTGAVVVLLLPIPPTSAASFQVAALLGRIPTFLAGAVALVTFPLMAASKEQSKVVTERAIGLYLRFAVPVAVVLSTMPSDLLVRLFPSYEDVDRVLPIMAITGAFLGAITLLATSHQAAERFSAINSRLALILAIQIAGLCGGWWVAGDVFGMAIGELVAIALGAIALLAWSAREIPIRMVPTSGAIIYWLAVGSTLFILRDWTIAWIAASLISGLLVLYQEFRSTAEDV